jgi:hypothetical protein
MEINYICSLGTLCHSAETMKRGNLKTCSYPFDWCFSGMDVVIDCIKDDFNVYLDTSYYIHISNNQCGHSKYGPHMWWHHNPLSNENDYAYFARCVDRFKKLLKLKDHKMFMITFVNGEYGSYEDNFNEKIIEFNRELQKFTENYILLVITNKITENETSHTFKCADNIHFLTLNTLSKSNGGHFFNDGDNTYLDNLLRQTYTFNLKDPE